MSLQRKQTKIFYIGTFFFLIFSKSKILAPLTAAYFKENIHKGVQGNRMTYQGTLRVPWWRKGMMLL